MRYNVFSLFLKPNKYQQMKKIILPLFALVLFCSHIMYLKLDTYFLEPNTIATIQLFNGTFDKSENVIDRDRMTNVSLLGNGDTIKVNESQWSEINNVTLLNFQTGDSGTWVAGVSTAPSSIEMDAEAFNTYLEHEGILDMLELRRNNDSLGNSAAVEKYSKHVKTIFQVGDKKTKDWEKALGYPIEFIPLTNPYELKTGDSLQVKLLLYDEPLVNQLVYADYKGSSDAHSHGEGEDKDGEHGHSHDEKSEAEHNHAAETEKGHSHDGNDADEPHQHTSGQQLRTDAEGIVTAKLTADGIWYVQTIHIVETKEEGFTHESNWTTLTFEVSHGHGEDSHTHATEVEAGIPSYVYWIGSFALIGVLFFFFKKNS